MAYTPQKEMRTSEVNYSPTGILQPFSRNNLDGDPHYDNVSLSLHMDGWGGVPTLLDSSQYAHSVSMINGATIDDTHGRFGNSGFLDGASSRFTVPANPAFALSSDATVEMFFYIAADSPAEGPGLIRTARLIGYGTGGSFEIQIKGDATSTGTGIYLKYGSVSLNANVPVAQGQWHHIAVSKGSLQVALFLNGERVAVGVSFSGVPANSINMGSTGLGGGNTLSFNGYIDEVRVTQGISRYEDDFPVPVKKSASYPLMSSTVLDPHYQEVTLLIHADGPVSSSMITDSGPRAHTITSHGATLVNQGSKFGQSIRLDAQHKIELPLADILDFINEDFTVEFDAQIDSLTGQNTFVTTRFALAEDGIQIYALAGELSVALWHTGMGTVLSTSVIVAPLKMKANTRHHIAIVRQGNEIRQYLDGILVKTNEVTMTATSMSSFISFGVHDSDGNDALKDMAGFLDEIRITRGVPRYSENFSTPAGLHPSASPVGDKHYNNVSLLLKGNGVNLSTTIKDSSNRSLALPEDPGIHNSSTSYVTGGSSIALQDKDMTIPTGTFDFSLNDFTIEFWVNLSTASSPFATLLSTDHSTGAARGFLIYVSGAGTSWGVSDTAVFKSTAGGGQAAFTLVSKSTNLRNGQWHHIAVVREREGHRLYINGVLEDTHYTELVKNYSGGAYRKLNGQAHYNNYSDTGYIDDLRVTKNVARYTESFSPSLSQPLEYTGPEVLSEPEEPLLGKVALLLHADGADGSMVFVDSSRHEAVATVAGDARVSTLTAAINDTSISFQSLTSSVSYPSIPAYRMGSLDFTLEMWVYPTSHSIDSVIACQSGSTVPVTPAWELRLRASSSFVEFRTSDGLGFWDNTMASSSSLNLNEWAHICVVGHDGDLCLFINGEEEARISGYGTIADSTWPLVLGSTNLPAMFYSGHIDEVQLVVGQALYKSNFNVRYKRFSGIESRMEADDIDASQVTLLLNVDEMSGSTTEDSSLYQHLVTTSGNPSISTGTFNTGSASSMYFDGNGDYITSSAGIANFETEDFCVEMWVNLSSTPSATWPKLFSSSVWLAGEGISIYVDGPTTGWAGEGHVHMSVALGSSGVFDLKSETIVRGDGWHHMAISRKSLTVSLYVDGYLEDRKRLPAITDLVADLTRFFTGEVSENEKGFLDSARITKGHHVYDDSFLPSTTLTVNLQDFDYDVLYPYNKLAREPSSYALQQQLSITAGDLTAKISGDGSTLIASYPSAAPTLMGKVYYATRTGTVWSGWAEILLADPTASALPEVAHVNHDGTRVIIHSSLGSGTLGGTVEIYDWTGSDYIRSDIFFDDTAIREGSSDAYLADDGSLLALNSNVFGSTYGGFSLYNLTSGAYLRDINTSMSLNDPLGVDNGINFEALYPASDNTLLVYSTKISRYGVVSVEDDEISYTGLVPASSEDRVQGFYFALNGSGHPIAVSTVGSDGVVSGTSFTVSGTKSFVPLVSSDGSTIAVVNHNHTGDLVPNAQLIDVYLSTDKIFTLSYTEEGLNQTDYLFSLPSESDASPEDPFFQDVALLLHMDGSDGSSTFIDSSKYAHGVTANASASIDGSIAQFGQSASFGTSGDYLSVSHSTALDLSVDVFTLEMWYRRAGNHEVDAILFSTAGNDAFAGLRLFSPGGGDSDELSLSLSSDGVTYDIGTMTISDSIPSGVWSHIAITKELSGISAYLDGVLMGRIDTTATLYNNVQPLVIGGQDGTSRTLLGYLDEVRLTTGVLRYSGDFDVPTEAFPGETAEHDSSFNDVVLLMHMDSAPNGIEFVDSSNFAHVYGSAGGTHIQSGQGTFGHSAYFNGVADTITISSGQEMDLGDDPFTIDISFSVVGPSIVNGTGTRDANLLSTWSPLERDGWGLTVIGNGAVTGTGIALDYWTDDANRSRYRHTLGSALVYGQLYRLSIVREAVSSVPKFYIDGVEVAVAREVMGADPGTIFMSEGHNMSLGGSAYTADTESFNGHMDEVRITAGVARYSADFTVSPQPFPDLGDPIQGDVFWDSVVYASHYDSESGLLDIVDSSPYGRVTTISGAATQSSAESKFGVSSLATLTAGHTSVSLPATSTRTVEVSFKRATLGQSGIFISDGNVIAIYLDHVNELSMKHTGVTYDTGYIVTDYNWHHIALVCTPSGTALFFDGVLVLNEPVTHSWDGPIILGSCASAFGIGEMNGWTDEVRITDAEKHTDDFYAPLQAYFDGLPTPNDPFYQDVSLLMHMDGDDGAQVFTDHSASAHTMSSVAGISTQNNKLLSTSAGHVRGPGGTEFELGVEDFTYEMQLSMASLNAHAYILTFEEDGDLDSEVPDLRFDTSDNTFRYYQDGSRISSSPILVDTIYNIAVTRTFGTVRLFMDGMLQGTYETSADLVAGANTPKIGRLAYTSTNAFRGTIDELRITKNVSRYIEDYIVPMDAFADTNDIVTLPPANGAVFRFDFKYEDEETTEYEHTFRIPYTISLFGVPNLLISDLVLTTNTQSVGHMFTFPSISETGTTVTYLTEFEYEISHIDDKYSFRLRYLINSDPLPSLKHFQFLYRMGLDATSEVAHRFSFRFNNTGYIQQEWERHFRFPYSFSISGEFHHNFIFRYTDESLILGEPHAFDLRYELEAINIRTYEFGLRYLDKSFVAGVEYVYHFRSLVGAVQLRELDFNLRYFYDEYVDVDYAFNLTYHTRLANAANPDNVTTTVVPDGNGGANFELEIIDVEVHPGEYVMVIDSGSTYSALFIKFTVPDTGTDITTVEVYNSKGVRIVVDFTAGLDRIVFEIENIDIDSSISISSYGVTNEQFSIMFNEWPNWSSYINADLENFSELVRLDSGNFKILPLQPNTCCVLQTQELCVLPPYSDVDNVELSVEPLRLEWIQVNTAIWDVATVGRKCSIGLAEAALTPNRTVSMLSAEIIGPGVLTFDWRIQATGMDSIWFEIDDLSSEHIYGTQDWETKTIDIPRGRYMLEWFYIKDEVDSSPTDISAIDKITYTHT